jgi:hypothetical protein
MGQRNSTFAAVANDATLVEGVQVDLVVGGTFVGTIQLQVAIPDATGANVWVPIGAGLHGLHVGHDRLLAGRPVAEHGRLVR